MKSSRHWRETITRNSYAGLAVTLIVVALGLLVFITTSILLAARARSNAAADLSDAQQQLAQAQNAQPETAGSLSGKLAAAQTALTQSLTIFLPDYQASQIVDALYQEAGTRGVAIVDFQTQVLPGEGAKPLYTATVVRMTVQGTSYNLLRYLSRIKYTAVAGFTINTIGITRAESLSNMRMEFSLFTSPYAPPRSLPSVEPPPAPTGTPPTPAGQTPSPEEQLAQPLDALWAAKNWPEVIRIVEQIRAINPNYDDVTNKAYSAHVNYGYQLQSEGRIEQAQAEFLRALGIRPAGAEAADALRHLSLTPTPTAHTVYIVQPGDTLFSIARRYGLTLQQLMQANGLTSFGIIVGQQLIIPLP